MPDAGPAPRPEGYARPMLAALLAAASAHADMPPPPPPAPDPHAALALVAPLGTDDLTKVGTLSFTFHVAVDGTERPARGWAWRPADGTVTRTVAGESLTFTFGKPTNDAEKKADAQFVNDSFWLAPQMHARWAGADLVVVDHGEAPLPVGSGSARHVELQYAPTGGGYSPGDAYDLYLDPAGRIVAWTYRGGGKAEDALTTTFEGYVQAGPLTLATEHRSADGKFRLYFTDVAVAAP